MGYGKNLKQLIQEKGLTIGKVATLTNISPQTLYSAIKRDSSIRYDMAVKISSLLGIDINQICNTNPYKTENMEEISSKKALIQSQEGSIGSRIRKIRILSGMTQKELGIQCGYSAETAENIVNQYESSRRIPKEKALETIARGLGVSKSVFYYTNLSGQNEMHHALFDMEDFHGLHPVKIGENYYLSFDTDLQSAEAESNIAFLKEWVQMRERTILSTDNIEGISKEIRAVYDMWRIRYPKDGRENVQKRIQELNKIQKMEKEIQQLRKEMMEEDEQIDIGTENSEIEEMIL